MRSFFFCIQLLILLSAMAVQLPASADQSRRVPVAAGGTFAMLTGQVSQVVPSDGGFGNGFVIGQGGCHVLTNFHVVFGVRTLKSGEIEMIDSVDVGHLVLFSFDLDDATGRFKRKMTAKVIDFGNYESGTSRGFLGDIALLRLDECLGKDYGALEFDRPLMGRLFPSGSLMTVSSSRASSGKNEVLVETGCRAARGTSVTGMILTNCESVPGMSGSMILEEGQDRKWRLVGMTTMHNVFSDGTLVSKAIYVGTIHKFLVGVIGEQIELGRP